ncbi:MAG: type II toxin-antitoxin system prevent-host-death family antitoxin [Rhizobiaceae bacterium]
MPKVSFPASEMARNTADILHKAAQEPVAITKHGKSRLVVMSQEHFERMLKGANPRRAAEWSELPDDELVAVEKAIDDYLAG